MTTTQPAPIVPSFDTEDSGRKLAIICSKGNLDMAYPALVLGNAALGEGIDTHLYFTFWGFDMIIDSRMDNLQFSPAGNTAMHFPVKGKDIRIPQAVMPLPGMTGMATKMLKDQLEAMDIEHQRQAEFNERLKRHRVQTTLSAAQNQAALRAKLINEFKELGGTVERDTDSDGEEPP